MTRGLAGLVEADVLLARHGRARRPAAGRRDDVRGVEVRGEDVVGRDGRARRGGPGSVVIATVPAVVRSQPATAPATTTGRRGDQNARPHLADDRG